MNIQLTDEQFQEAILNSEIQEKIVQAVVAKIGDNLTFEYDRKLRTGWDVLRGAIVNDIINNNNSSLAVFKEEMNSSMKKEAKAVVDEAITSVVGSAFGKAVAKMASTKEG